MKTKDFKRNLIILVSSLFLGLILISSSSAAEALNQSPIGENIIPYTVNEDENTSQNISYDSNVATSYASAADPPPWNPDLQAGLDCYNLYFTSVLC